MTMYFQFSSDEPRSAVWAPAVDVSERDAEIVIFVEMPGVNRQDVHLHWKDGVLSVIGLKREHPPERGMARYLCLERIYGRFRRDISINIPIDHSRAKAELRDGLMKIYLPKLGPADVANIPIE
jgi:HSP20 family protein